MKKFKQLWYNYFLLQLWKRKEIPDIIKLIKFNEIKKSKQLWTLVKFLLCFCICSLRLET
jgi:hypothetical protein